MKFINLVLRFFNCKLQIISINPLIFDELEGENLEDNFWGSNVLLNI